MHLRPTLFLRQWARFKPPPHCRPYFFSPHAPPLRILFCGSDHFSATSLKALYNEHVNNRYFIASIDVVCRKAAREGRGLKRLREVPIRTVAEELNLPVHEIFTFTGWEPPIDPPINLIVAVSFGLKVPPRILFSTPYAGVNVHPSLLPTYRGPAPIYHALLDAAPFTGVTIQTLHPDIIDHGSILLQSEEIPIQPGTQYTDLHDNLAVLGAEMLVHTCRQRLFAPPITAIRSSYPPSNAPKIKPDEHSRVKWDVQDARTLERYCGVLGTLWARLGENDDMDRRPRVILSQIEVWKGDVKGRGSYKQQQQSGGGPTVPGGGEGPVLQEPVQYSAGNGEVTTESHSPEQPMQPEKVTPGTWRYVLAPDKEDALIIKCKTGWIRVRGIKVEGRPLRHAGEWARSRSANKTDYRIFT